ncbi:hypothetical protein STEG23_013881, partial [Scotinomys teguina]
MVSGCSWVPEGDWSRSCGIMASGCAWVLEGDWGSSKVEIGRDGGRNIHFKNGAENLVVLNSQRKADEEYDIINFWNFPENLRQEMKVGTYSPRAPQITIGQFDTILSDRVQYNSLYQTAPKDTSLSHGIVILMVHFSWTWVGLVLVDDYEGAEILSDLRGEMDSSRVCMTFVVRIPDNFHSSIYYNSKINFLKLVLSSANVVIIYREIESLYPIILIIVTHFSYSRVWVMNSH